MSRVQQHCFLCILNQLPLNICVPDNTIVLENNLQKKAGLYFDFILLSHCSDHPFKAPHLFLKYKCCQFQKIIFVNFPSFFHQTKCMDDKVQSGVINLQTYNFIKNRLWDRRLPLTLMRFFKRTSLWIEVITQRYSVKKVFLTISQNSWDNTSARLSFLVKLYSTPSVAASLWNNG